MPSKTVWVQDVNPVDGIGHLPLSSQQQGAEPGQTDDFPGYFARLLKRLSIPLGLQAIKASGFVTPLPSVDHLAAGWDFARVKARLIASVPGKYEGWESVLRWGHLRLMLAAREAGGVQNKDDDSLECQVCDALAAFTVFVRSHCRCRVHLLGIMPRLGFTSSGCRQAERLQRHISLLPNQNVLSCCRPQSRT